MRLVRMIIIALAMVGALALASTALASTNDWTRLGGDPLVPGGVNSRASFVHVMTSAKGSTAMKFAGLNKAERLAVVAQVRKGNFSSCTMNFNQMFWRMSFGINGTSVDRNVRFRDQRFQGGAPSWCVTATVGGKGGYKVSLLMPLKCGNVAIPRKPIRKLPPVKKPTPKKPTANVPPGSCNITITNSTVTGDIANCSTVTIVVACGIISKPSQVRGTPLSSRRAPGSRPTAISSRRPRLRRQHLHRRSSARASA
jgi:hypothetical protein